MNMTAIFAMMAFTAGTKAHIAHFKTKVFAQHLALETFYTDLVPLVDKIIEVYQGEFGIIESYPKSISLPDEPQALVTVFRNWIAEHKKAIGPTDELQNLLESVQELNQQTLYKLVNLR